MRKEHQKPAIQSWKDPTFAQDEVIDSRHMDKTEFRRW